MIGTVGTILGDAGVNISDMHLGQNPEGVPSMMLIATNGPVPPTVQAALEAEGGVQSVRVLELA